MIQLARFFHGASPLGFVGRRPGGGAGGAGSALDTSIAAPVLSLGVPANTYPPELDAVLAADVIAGTYSLRLQADDDYLFGTPFLNKAYSISDSEATAHIKLLGADLSSIVSPAVTFFRARVEWDVAGVTHYTNWSNTQGHGDVTAPTITSSTSPTSAELAPVLITITASEVSNFVLAGADAAKLELIGAQPAASIQLRLLANAIPDYEDPTPLTDLGGGLKGYAFTIKPTDLSGNPGSATAIALSINDVDELANSFTFTDVTGAALSTVYTSNTITVAGLATGVSAPVAISGGTYSKNGGAYTSSAGTVVNTDTIAVRVTSSASETTTVSATLTIGDVVANQVSDTYSVATLSTAAPPSGSTLWLAADDLTTLFQSNAGVTAVAADGDVVGYWGDKSGNAFHLTSAADNSTRPVYKVVAAKSLIRFDGIDDFLRKLASLGLYAAGASTVGIAVLSSAAANKGMFGSGRTSNNNPEYLPIMSNSGTGNQADCQVRNDAGTLTKTNNSNLASNAFDGTAKTLIVTDSGSSWSAYLNGSLAAQSPDAYTRSGTLTLDVTGLGGIPRGTPTSFMAFDLYALVAYPSILGSTDIATLHTYLASKI